MSRLFDDASNEYLYVNQSSFATYPFAICTVFRMDADVTASLIDIADKDVNTSYHRILAMDSGGGSFLRASSNAPATGGGASAISTSGWTIDTWHHAGAIFAAANDRRIFIDGGSKGTNATAKTPTNLERTWIGELAALGGAANMSGDIAEMAIWDLTNWPGATASDKADNFEKAIASMAKGFTPVHFPLGLKAYWPLVRSLNDRIGGYNLTANGTTISAHPRIIQPCGTL